MLTVHNIDISVLYMSRLLVELSLCLVTGYIDPISEQIWTIQSSDFRLISDKLQLQHATQK